MWEMWCAYHERERLCPEGVRVREIAHVHYESWSWTSAARERRVAQRPDDVADPHRVSGWGGQESGSQKVQPRFGGYALPLANQNSFTRPD